MNIIEFIEKYKEIFEEEKYDDPETEFSNLVTVFLQHNIKILFKKETYQEMQKHYQNVNTIYTQLYNETGLIELVYIMLENMDTNKPYNINWVFEQLYKHYQETKNKDELMRIIKISEKSELYLYNLVKLFKIEVLELINIKNYRNSLVKTA